MPIGMSSGVRGLIGRSSGAFASMSRNQKMGVGLGLAVGTNALGYAGVTAYGNERDASKMNMFGTYMLGGYGGGAALARLRKKQGHPAFTRPGSVNNHLFPGGSGQEM